MGWREKYVYSEANIWNVVFGLISISISFGLIIFAYGEIIAQLAGEQLAFNITTENFASTMLTIWLGIFLFGVIGGYEVGRYIQTEFVKRKRKVSKNP